MFRKLCILFFALVGGSTWWKLQSPYYLFIEISPLAYSFCDFSPPPPPNKNTSSIFLIPHYFHWTMHEKYAALFSIINKSWVLMKSISKFWMFHKKVERNIHKVLSMSPEESWLNLYTSTFIWLYSLKKIFFSNQSENYWAVDKVNLNVFLWVTLMSIFIFLP